MSTTIGHDPGPFDYFVIGLCSLLFGAALFAMAFGQQQNATPASTTTTTIAPVTPSPESAHTQASLSPLSGGTDEPRVTSTPKPTPTPKPQTCHNQVTYMPMMIGKVLIEEPITTQVCQ